MSPYTTETRVPASHPALPGHFPGQPVVPGVVLLAMVHELADKALGFGGGASAWRRVKFLAPVLPEQDFTIELDGDEAGFSFMIRLNDDTIVARGQCRHAALA